LAWGAVQYEQPRNLYLIFGYLNFRYPVDARHGSPVGRLLAKGMDMKLYLSMFLAVICMPIASLAGIFAMELGYVLSFRQAIGIGVLVGTVILILAVIFFLLSIPSTMQRLRTSNCTGNKSQG
jgi:ABC-type amino acid transport system permease subunit